MVANTTKLNYSSTWNILLTLAKCPTRYCSAHLQMETTYLQMAIVAVTTKIHKCKHSVAGEGRGAGAGNASEAAEGGQGCSGGAPMSLRSRGGESDGAEPLPD